ncbi:AAA family ATPase [Caulobacter sp. KR2-114]|uniref:AAA family ATPase n=1 Tax=Caulobacter sp. KR2-114 TaxID=3400912 RepID=UPI003BFFD4DA
MRQIVLISGSPGAGKSTLALPLAERLGWPLLSKDHIKETLFDAMGGVGDSLEESRRFGAGAMGTLWALAARCPQVVLEANFRPRSDYERARLLGLRGQVVEVHCACPMAEAMRRFKARGAAGVHAAHPWRLMDDAAFAEFDRPVGVGDLITVDTTRPTDIEGIAGEIARRFANGAALASG